MTATTAAPAVWVSHEQGCAGPPLQAKDVPDGVKHQCPSCRRFWIVYPPRPSRTSGYVCRVHHEQAVTWRGTGCALCSPRKPQQRKASQPSDYEMENR